ncbi:Uu.00g057320.m01.CDS01 [Anthostomella pinea]|uniref:Uu.00g057320.m01.CDS01 n=1 Tax=Anthostomella pinea TaxID=933095 RepID=A0AAI8VRN8_9PEZI|nr:Uu.00g057320.m01.CDS01 [Anthostomella pinea]
MRTPTSQCRGFTHPFLLLIRSTFKTSSEVSSRTISNRPWLQTTHDRLRGRAFTTGRALHKGATPGAKSTPSRPSPATAITTGSLARNLEIPQMSYAQHLARKANATILYEAAPQRAFLFSSYSAAFFTLGVAGINSWLHVYNVPEGLAWWVPFSFGSMTLLLAVLGTKFALIPASVIRSIKILPEPATTTGGSAASKSRGAAPPVRLEVVARRNSPFPGLPLKRIIVEPHELVMKSRLHNRPRHMTPHEKGLAKQEEAKRREYEMTHLMTAPFRDARRALSTIFAGIRRGLVGGGFAPVIINGAKYKLDITRGYALEDGQVLDRIVKIEEDPAIAQLRSQKR